MTERPRRRRQKAVCALCTGPIGEGEGIRRITHDRLPGALPVHGKCYDRDWETIEAGLEPFPLRIVKRS
jgi:hypothetical protein